MPTPPAPIAAMSGTAVAHTSVPATDVPGPAVATTAVTTPPVTLGETRRCRSEKERYNQE